MNAQLSPSRSTEAQAPRFDRNFIEEHRLLERYLTGKLPLRGARDLEAWCRSNPQYLEELELAQRTQMSLKLLEASGRSQDLSEPSIPWWKSIYVQIGVGVIAFVSMFAFWVLLGKYMLARNALDDARTLAKQGPMAAPQSILTMRVEPDRAPGINHARVTVNHAVPSMLDLRMNLGYTKLTLFKLTMEKKEQGRALVIDNLGKDSNAELKVSFNTTSLTPGHYDLRLDGLPFRGDPIGEGWLILNVQ
jgi:hypothetical protein